MLLQPPILKLTSFLNTSYINVGIFSNYSIGHLCSISFQLIFCLLFKLDKLYYCVLTFLSSVISTLPLSPFNTPFTSVAVLFSSIIFIWFLWTWFCYILFSSIISREYIIDCRSIFMINALKSLSDNSNIRFILVSASIDFSSFKL